MKQKLILLNLALAAAIVWCGYEIRLRAEFVKEREARAAAPMSAPPAAKPAAAASVAPVAAAGYIDVANRLLFAKDRNSQVVIETPPPPPEKPLPALPVARGVMNLGDGPFVLMAEQAQSRYIPVRPGQTIGSYRLAKLDGDQLTLTWEEKTVVKRLDELKPAVEARSSAPAAAQSSTATPAPASPPVVAVRIGEPGTELSEGLRACQPGDTAPAGTTSGGYRKVVSRTPFGESCRWETAK